MGRALTIKNVEGIRFPAALKVTIGSQSPTDGIILSADYTIYFYSKKEVQRMVNQNKGTYMFLEFSQNLKD